MTDRKKFPLCMNCHQPLDPTVPGVVATLDTAGEPVAVWCNVEEFAIWQDRVKGPRRTHDESE